MKPTSSGGVEDGGAWQNCSGRGDVRNKETLVGPFITWYSGDLVADRPWVLAMFDLTDIWKGVIDMGMLQ